jgi:hypothetical protein
MDQRLENFENALPFITSYFKSSFDILLNKYNNQPLYLVNIYKFIEMVYNSYQSYLDNCIEPRNTSFNLRYESNVFIPNCEIITYGKRNYINMHTYIIYYIKCYLPLCHREMPSRGGMYILLK